MTELVQPIKRVEQYLYALCVLDFSNIPVPRSRLEIFTHAMITGELPEIAPETREEEYMVAIIKGDVSNLPTPKSRADHLLYRICLGETEIRDIELETRYEMLLAYLAEHGGTDLEHALINFTKAFETLYNTVEMPVRSAILSGHTLVNLSENLATVTRNVSGWYVDEKILNDIGKLKVNTDYTVLYRLENISGNHENYKGIEIGIGATGFQSYIPNIKNVVNKSGDWCKVKFQLTDSFIAEYPTYTKMHIRPIRRGNAPVEGESITYTIKGFAILEGDYTVNTIPFNEVFEGMQSVKMPVLTTTGKNLFGGILTSGQLLDNNVTNNNQTKMGYSEFSPVEEKTDICCSYYTNSNYKIEKIFFYDENKTQIGSVTTPRKVTTPKGTKYFRFSITTTNWSSSVVFNDIKDDFKIQVETGTGTQTTPYEPYKSNILTVNEEVELRGIGNVQDTLDCLTGELTQRIGEIVLDGSSDEEYNQSDLTLNNTIAFGVVLYDIKPKGAVINNKFITSAINDNSDYEHSYSSTYRNKSIVWFFINKGKLSSFDVSGFRQWLSQNPITLQYQLATESIKTVDLSVTDQDDKPTALKTFNDVTHVETQADSVLPTVILEYGTKNEEALAALSQDHEEVADAQAALSDAIDSQSDEVETTMMALTEVYEGRNEE